MLDIANITAEELKKIIEAYNKPRSESEIIEEHISSQAFETLENLTNIGDRDYETEVADETWIDITVDRLGTDPDVGNALDEISQAYDGSDRLKNAVLKSTGSRQEKLIKMGTEIWAKQKIAEREYAESVELYGDDEQDAYDPEDER